MNKIKICIYCLGEYGIQTYYKLKESGAQIDYFGDRDKEKQGYAFDGLYCLSYEQVLTLDKMKTIIIVAVKNPNGLINSFKSIGFEQVYSKEQAIDLLCKKEKIDIKPMDQIDEIKQIKELLADCLYNKKVNFNGCKINKDCENMMSDYIERNFD